MTRRGTDEVRRATRRLVAAQTAAFAASGVGVGLAPLPLSGGGRTARGPARCSPSWAWPPAPGPWSAAA